MPNQDLAHSQEKQTWRWASEELCVQSGEFPWWLWSGGDPESTCSPHCLPLEVQLSHVLPFPWLLSRQPTSPLSKPRGDTSPFPAQGPDSPEGKRGGGEQEWRGIAGSRGMWTKARAAGPPECGSHLQRTAGKPVQDGCGDSWRAWRSTHAILASQLSHTLHCLPSSGSLACWPYPNPQVTSCTKSNLLVPSVESELQYHDLGGCWLLWPKTARQREQG